MPAPIPFEPPVTRATLPANDFVCVTTINILLFIDYTIFWMILSRIWLQYILLGPEGQAFSVAVGPVK